MDTSLGRLLDHLEEQGIAEETVILFASDNGSANPLGQPVLRDKKGSLHEGGVRVPIIASWAQPNSNHPLQQRYPIQPESRHEGLVHLRDFFPTLLELAGAKPTAPDDGHSLLKTLAEPDINHLPQQLGIHFPHGRKNWRAGTAWFSGEWKLIHRWATGESELYHLWKDPGETVNMIDQEPRVATRLQEEMTQWLEETDAQTEVILKTEP